jgi:hypothetical protein
MQPHHPNVHVHWGEGYDDHHLRGYRAGGGRSIHHHHDGTVVLFEFEQHELFDFRSISANPGSNLDPEQHEHEFGPIDFAEQFEHELQLHLWSVKHQPEQQLHAEQHEPEQHHVVHYAELLKQQLAFVVFDALVHLHQPGPDPAGANANSAVHDGAEHEPVFHDLQQHDFLVDSEHVVLVDDSAE